MSGLTIAEKIWNEHVVRQLTESEVLLYIDLHLLHEINTPQAFDYLHEKNLIVRVPEKTFATEDHNTPTDSIHSLMQEDETWTQVRLLRENCAQFGIEQMRLGQPGQGITHVIAPEQGRVQPGMTVVCCDSHTTTHGAFGALAFGIGTSQVAHVLATQTLRAFPFKTFAVEINGTLPSNVSAKDLALSIIRQIGTGGGQGHVIEYRGTVISALSMEARMTLCNMTVEAGASAGIISPDDKTIEYLCKALQKRGISISESERSHWLSLATDLDATFDKTVHIDASALEPLVSWGTNPSQVIGLSDVIPDAQSFVTPEQQLAAKQALKYMGLKGGETLESLAITNVFIGSCTNGRIEDLRTAASIFQSRRVHPDVHVLVVPGSMSVYQQAVDEGLDSVFRESGVDFRSLPGCSLCTALNSDRLEGHARTLSTNNRNFEGRQGPNVRTHIASVEVAAATAIHGYICSPSYL